METHSPKELDQQAQAAYARSEYGEAARFFQAASSAYEAQEDRAAAAEMSNNQSVALLQAEEPQAALDAALGTQEVFESQGDAKRQAMALGNQAAALEALERLEEAEKAYTQSAALLQAAGEDELYATVMRSISALQLRSGRQLEALASMQTGMDNVKRPSLKQRLLRKLLKSPLKFLQR